MMRARTRTPQHLGITVSALVIASACGPDRPPSEVDEQQSPGAAAPSSVCQRTLQGEAGDLALARCLAAPELTPTDSSGGGRVVVYFDRSGSMRGFLDPNHPTRIPTDYRSVIDRLVVGLRPAAGFSFGSALRPADPTLATFGNRAFYTDRDTQTEQVLAEIARDSAAAATHMIVTDGRRGSPSSGDAQFVRMRELAHRWIALGGSFVVATSLAPFQTVATDPSGCRQSAGGTTSEPQTCPLYVFGFVAPGEGVRIAATLAGVFEHLFVWPAPTIPPAELTLVPTDAARRDLHVERRWASAPKGTPIVRVRGDSATNRILTVTIALRDSSSAEARAYASILAAQGGETKLHSRAFKPEAAAQRWRAVEARGALVRASSADSADDASAGEGAPHQLALDLVSRGPRAPITIFRVDLVPGGVPAWLDDFDAADAGDVIRTYGLGRLFEGFREAVSGGKADPIGRFFIVAS
jgi:hypothetical protein